MLPPMGPPTGVHAAVMAPGPVAAGACLVAAATLAGAWLARRRPGQQRIWLGAAAGALLVIAGVHVLPDAWSGAPAGGSWPWAGPTAALASVLLAGVGPRAGCA